MACKCRNIGLSWAAQPILGTVYLFIFSYYNSRLAWAKVKEKKMLLHSSELVTVRNSWSFWGRVNHLIWPNSNFAISWGSDTNPWHHYDQESLRNLVPLDRVLFFSLDCRSCLAWTLTFLTNLPAHGGLEPGQVLLLRLGQAVRDGEGGVVEGVGALGVPVTPALPALDAVSWEKC